MADGRVAFDAAAESGVSESVPNVSIAVTRRRIVLPLRSVKMLRKFRLNMRCRSVNSTFRLPMGTTFPDAKIRGGLDPRLDECAAVSERAKRYFSTSSFLVVRVLEP